MPDRGSVAAPERGTMSDTNHLGPEEAIRLLRAAAEADPALERAVEAAERLAEWVALAEAAFEKIRAKATTQRDSHEAALDALVVVDHLASRMLETRPGLGARPKELRDR